MAKNRKKKGVNRRVAEREIAAEPGMYEHVDCNEPGHGHKPAQVTADDLREYRDVAEAFPPDKRNPENSWEVHQMLMNHPGRFDLIKQPWTESSLAARLDTEFSYVVGARDDKLDPMGLHRSVADVIRGNGKVMDDPEIESILLDMEAKGLIEALPDGQMLVKGTKAQLMEYGIDPTDKSIFDSEVAPSSVHSVVPGNPYGIKGMDGYPVPERHVNASQDMIDDYMTAYSKKGFAGDDLVLVHGAPGETPMMFPREVLAKAQAHGEKLVPFTEAEMTAWKKTKGDKASVRFVLDYNDEDNTTTSTTKDDLDAAWYRAQDDVAAVEKKLGIANEQVSHAATNLLAATEGMSSGWTLGEVTTHLKVSHDRTAEIIQGMVDRGHVEMKVREDGEHVYRMTEDGRQHQMRALALQKEQHEDFDDNDPRFQDKKWFHDANVRMKR